MLRGVTKTKTQNIKLFALDMDMIIQVHNWISIIAIIEELFTRENNENFQKVK